MAITNGRLFFFAFLKDSAGAALKKAAPAPAPEFWSSLKMSALAPQHC